MAERPIWRGHLRLALVSCPVALHTAHRETSNLHFNFINPKTGNRVRMVTLDAQTDEELTRRNLARGYEFEKDQYVLMDDEDFEKARIESSSTLTVDKFVTADSIDPVYFDTSYYMAPDGDSAQDVYVVLRDAIRQAKTVALSRVVISRRERAVAIMPMQDGLIVHTLYEHRDIANPAKPVRPGAEGQTRCRHGEARHPADRTPAETVRPFGSGGPLRSAPPRSDRREDQGLGLQAGRGDGA